MKLYSENKDYKLYNGSMLYMLEVIKPNSIDSIITDPPYELNFMNKGWDNSGIAFQKETWEQCFKVLKPGGYLLAFGGSGTVSLNVPYDNIVYNELNENMVNLLKLIRDEKPEIILNHINKRINQFNLNKESADIRRKNVSKEYILKYKKQYLKFSDFYNKSEEKDIKDLYTLSFYSFCNLMRFNSKNEFNMPYGNRCFIEEDKIRLLECYNRFLSKNITLICGNSFDLLKSITKNENQFLYFDPPYSNSTAIYNEKRAFGSWDKNCDDKLFEEMDRLTSLGIKWAYSNVLKIKGKTNKHIEEWANKNNYTIIEFENKEYASLGKGNADAREVLIINYKQLVKQLSIYDF